MFQLTIFISVQKVSDMTVDKIFKTFLLDYSLGKFVFATGCDTKYVFIFAFYDTEQSFSSFFRCPLNRLTFAHISWFTTLQGI